MNLCVLWHPAIHFSPTALKKRMKEDNVLKGVQEWYRDWWGSKSKSNYLVSIPQARLADG